MQKIIILTNIAKLIIPIGYPINIIDLAINAANIIFEITKIIKKRP